MKKGFTLVEIMIVVAIIGIIIAIAVPAFLRARENARSRACQENLAKIDGAKEQWALDTRAGNNAAVTWANLIKEAGTGYLKTTPKCPAQDVSVDYGLGNVGQDPTCGYDAPPYATDHDLQGANEAAAQ